MGKSKRVSFMSTLASWRDDPSELRNCSLLGDWVVMPAERRGNIAKPRKHILLCFIYWTNVLTLRYSSMASSHDSPGNSWIKSSNLRLRRASTVQGQTLRPPLWLLGSWQTQMMPQCDLGHSGIGKGFFAIMSRGCSTVSLQSIGATLLAKSGALSRDGCSHKKVLWALMTAGEKIQRSGGAAFFEID